MAFSNSNKNNEDNKKNNIYNRLYYYTISREKNIKDLEYKIYQSEEEKCTFSPKTNNGKISCRFTKNNGNNKLFEIKINNPRYSYSFKSSNFNNINKNNDKYENEKNNHFLYDKFAEQTNPLFYTNNNLIKNNVTYSYNKKNNKLPDNKFINNKNNKNYFIKKVVDNFKNQNNISKNNLFIMNNNSNLEEDNYKSSRNINYIKKSKTSFKNNSATYINYFNNMSNDNQIKGDKPNLNNNSKSNNFLLIENQTEKLNKNYFYNSHSNLRTNLNNKVICNLTKKYKILKENNYTNRNDNKRIENKNNKSLNDLYNIKIDNNEKINKNNRRNFLQKNILNSFNELIPISLLTAKNRNSNERILYDPMKKYKNLKINNQCHDDDNTTFLHKKSKSLNYNKILSDISSSFLNNNINNKNNSIIANNNANEKNNNKLNHNYNTNNNRELFKENDDNIYFDKKNINNELDKKEYYYTFRKGKIPYNSFNYLSTKKAKNNINNSNKNNNNPIYLIDIQSKEKYCSAQYNTNISRTNSIYLNNYNRKICRIKKEKKIKSTNNSFHNKNNSQKGSLSDLTYKKDSIKQVSNTNFNTNNDTKGASISSFSLYQTKSPKDNQSIKNSSRQECNSSIENSKRKNKNISLSNPNSLNKRKIKKKNKQNIRKYINSINNNMESIVQSKKKGLNYYCYCPDEKTNEKKNNLKIDSKVVNECYINLNKDNIINRNKKCFLSNLYGKNEKSMTLQSLSDSKMMELADYYINNGDDSLEQIDLKLIELKKNIKKERAYRDITFG